LREIVRDPLAVSRARGAGQRFEKGFDLIARRLVEPLAERVEDIAPAVQLRLVLLVGCICDLVLEAQMLLEKAVLLGLGN
jgi:hypothetical protein